MKKFTHKDTPKILAAADKAGVEIAVIDFDKCTIDYRGPYEAGIAFMKYLTLTIALPWKRLRAG